MKSTGSSSEPWLSVGSDLAADGYTLVREALDTDQITQLRDLMKSRVEPHSLRSQGLVVAARNLLETCPEIAAAWKTPALIELLKNVLGPEAGLVRALYFDKPPGRTWGLPWHRDQTIAVKEHRHPVEPFAKPTVKEGVAHVEATVELLNRMLTVRLHLDQTDADNGALRVIAGSHRLGDDNSHRMATIEAAAGDALLMRPLLSHSSGPSQEGTARHRRVVHLEFAAEEHLPGGYQWHDFHRL